MDKRQLKTRQAIFNACHALLQEKKYDAITMSDIIATANIGRSTCYAHFQTKEEVLTALCSQLFERLFLVDSKKEKAHDLTGRISILFKKVHKEAKEIRAIIHSEGEEIFARLFQEEANKIFLEYKVLMPKNIPTDYGRYHFAHGLYAALKWWLVHKNRGAKIAAEPMAQHFITAMHLNDRAIALKLF